MVCNRYFVHKDITFFLIEIAKKIKKIHKKSFILISSCKIDVYCYKKK